MRGFNRADEAQHKSGRADALKIYGDLRNYKYLGCVNEPKTTQIGTEEPTFSLTGEIRTARIG